MVWSVLVYEKELLENILKEMNADKTISTNKLHLIFMRTTKATSQRTLAEGIKIFERFGFLKLKSSGMNLFEIDTLAIETRLIQLQV